MVEINKIESEIDVGNMRLLDLVREFNKLMSSAIEGPNCINPNLCHADCCHIHIDVPKELAEYHIKNGNADRKSFIRGDVFSFQIEVREKDAKCVFYSEELNGCSLHSTGMKPPQCWIYPTGFSNNPGEEKQFASDGTIKCKRLPGWWIIDETKTEQARRLFDRYVSICKQDFVLETSTRRVIERIEAMRELLERYGPSQIEGIKDGWHCFEPIPADNVDISIKHFCSKHQDNKNSEISENSERCGCSFSSCKKMCKNVIEELLDKLKDVLPDYIEKNGAKSEYTFFELFSIYDLVRA